MLAVTALTLGQQILRVAVMVPMVGDVGNVVTLAAVLSVMMGKLTVPMMAVVSMVPGV